MNHRQQLIDEFARLCGPSVVVLNLDDVQTGAPTVDTTRLPSARRPIRPAPQRRRRARLSDGPAVLVLLGRR